MSQRSPRAGQGGRPRVFQNEDVFRAVTRVLTQSGYGQLTFDSIAMELGCTGPALSRRFGAKQALVAAYLDWMLNGIHERFEAAKHTDGSPLAALLARVSIPV